MRIQTLLLFSVFVLLFIAPAIRADLIDWDTDIILNEDSSTDWTVTFIYNETITRSDYFFLGPLRSFNITADGAPADCRLSLDVGYSFLCDNISAKTVVYKFRTYEFVDIIRNLRQFKYRFAVLQSAEKFSVTIRLPVGSPLADQQQLGGTLLKPFEPEFGRQGSDGRRIFVSWVLGKPQLGTTMDMSVLYEPQLEELQVNIFIAAIAGLVIAFIIILFLLFKRKPAKDILPVLTAGERKVVEIVLREKGTVDQRQIVKETDFSKAKVSRIISNLVSRGVLEKEVKGRKNLIRLKKAIKAEKLEKTAKAEIAKKEG